MKPKSAIFLILFSGVSFAARQVRAEAQLSGSLPIQILSSGKCMVTQCGIYTLLFVVVPALAIWFYKRFLNPL